MSDAAIFVLVFGGLFVLRIVAATVFFFFILPEGDRCVNCDAPTLRVQRAFWHRWLPWFRPSWCMECGWKGMLRSGPITPGPSTEPSTKLSVRAALPPAAGAPKPEVKKP